MDISDDQIREAFDAAMDAMRNGWRGALEGIRIDDNHSLLDFDIYKPFITATVYVSYSINDENPLRTRVFSQAKQCHDSAYGVVEIDGGKVTFRP